jgi:uncharacterized SAM-binding protein YcdF (DUF218 family)
MTPTSAAIVIFGAAVRPDGSPSNALRRRVEAAVAFGQRLDAPLFVPTGAAGRHGPPEAAVMADLLRRLGVPDARIVCEQTGKGTLSLVRAVARLLEARGHLGPVYAASNAYHLPRCVALLWLAGLPARACPPPAGPASRRWCKRWYWRLREVPALPFDAALAVGLRLIGRFRA